MWILTGAKFETQKVTDTMLKIRSIGDQMHLAGVTQAALKSAAMTQVLNFCRTGHYMKLSVGVAEHMFGELDRDLDWIVKLLEHFKPGRLGWVIGTLAFACYADRRAEGFVTAFAEGDNIATGHPAKTARTWLINKKSMNFKKQYKQPLIEGLFNAAYNHIHGGRITTIKPGAQGLDYFTKRASKFVQWVDKATRTEPKATTT